MRLLIWLLLIYIGYRIVKGYLAQREVSGRESPGLKGEETHKDPVCGVYVAGEDAVVGNLEGEKIYFCSMECLNKFQEQLQHKS
ncbi:MAG: hypothetical protein FD174_1125 [Geobacteraceae bacterium]|nr:MAG: hypothetical protein FD174_1125 [Geobacteraceae bacterium]